MMKLRHLVTTAAWLSLCSPAAAGIAQWCSADATVNACVAINSTAPSLGDVHISVSSVFPSGHGWAALGSGSAMANAAMIVFYPNADGSELTVGVRKTDHGHAPPQMAEDLMDRLEVHTTKQEDTYSAEITCHDCAVDQGAIWLWAFNTEQALTDANDFNAPLEMHSDFGRFAIDEATALDGAAFPTTRETVGIAPLSHHPEGVAHEHADRTLIVIHGMFMSVAFLILFPLGALAIRYPSPVAFKRHWLLQATAGGAVIFGAIFSLSKVLTMHTLWESFQKPHHGIGQVLTVAVILQAALGWKHHQDYVKLGQRTRISDWHVWLGRAVLVVGMGNTAYGASFKHWLLGSAFMTWLVVLAIAGCWGAAWVWVMRKHAEGKTGAVGIETDEQAYELLDEEERERRDKDGHDI